MSNSVGSISPRRKIGSVVAAGAMALAACFATSATAFEGTAVDDYGSASYSWPFVSGCMNVLGNDTDVGTLVGAGMEYDGWIDTSPDGTICITVWDEAGILPYVQGAYTTSTNDVAGFTFIVN